MPAFSAENSSTDSMLDALERGLTMSKADTVFHHVRRDILLGVLVPNEQLLEQRIADTLRCSQGTVREALMRLEQDGLVDRRGYRGTVVVEPGVREVAEMVRIRTNIECLGLRRSVPGFATETLDRLDELAERMGRSGAAGENYLCSEYDRVFHLTLLREAALPGLEPILLRCILNMHRFTFDTSKGQERSTYDDCTEDHRAIVQVVRDGDPDAAERLLRAHVDEMIREGAPQLMDY